MNAGRQTGELSEDVPERDSLAVVVIGRNEGQRLAECLRSVKRVCDDVVYVDSGSTDGSIDLAAALGAQVVELDPARPFTAGRARNEGVRALRARPRPPRLVQVLDGDCGLVPTWVSRAAAFLAENQKVGIVCGRRRERHPEASVYNRLCDMEWDTPVGPAAACGGDALMLLEVFEEAGGYDPTMIAGEDPEFSYRVRRQGWEIHRISEEMTLHDANISTFRQWRLRTKRAGHAYAECFAMHRKDGSGFRRREFCSILFWGLALPLTALIAAPIVGGWSLLAVLGYAVLWIRVRRHRTRRADAAPLASLYATFCVIGKFAEALGAVCYGFERVIGSSGKLIEYKREAGAQRGTGDR